MDEPEPAVFPKAAGRATGGLELRCVVFARRGDEVLLVRHRRHPVYGSAWTLPGGVLDYGRNPRDSAARILAAQTGTVPMAMRLLRVQSVPEGDRRLTFHFEAAFEGIPGPGAGILEARKVDLAGDVAIDLHPSARADLEGHRFHELSKAG